MGNRERGRERARERKIQKKKESKRRQIFSKVSWVGKTKRGSGKEKDRERELTVLTELIMMTERKSIRVVETREIYIKGESETEKQ